jgi:hypothetical protein
MRISAIALAGLMMFGAPANAQKAGKGNDHGDGQKVAVDGKGKIRELTPEESKQLSDAMDKSLKSDASTLTPTRTASGALAVDLGESFESTALAKVGPNGKVVTKCVTSAEEGKQFFGVNEAKKKKHKKNSKPAAQSSTQELETR